MMKNSNSVAFFIDVLSETHEKSSTISFPKIKSHLLRPSAKQLKEALDQRLLVATSLRAKYIEERKARLARQAHALKVRVLIHESRQRLEKLRMQAKSEWRESSAELNRAVSIRKIREKMASKVEHAKRIMLVQKMKKFMELRRALSENFVDLLKQDMELYEEIEEENNNSPVKTVAEVKNVPQKKYNSEFLFPKESLADSIKRTKSLPDLVMKDGDDATFLELVHLLPPVTRFTLRELEMEEILSNAQLRHDILFDADLQFKAAVGDEEEPNEVYWAEFGREVLGSSLYRIPLLLAEVRAILVELLPNGLEIKDDIFSHIDCILIAQQIEHQIMDPKPLIGYVSGLMKINCAPIRDSLVEKMVVECNSGDIALSLATCFEILELMKLVYLSITRRITQTISCRD